MVNFAEVVSYSTRTISWGSDCGDAHYKSGFTTINGKRAVLFRGINVYLIKRDGSWRYAQSDTHAHNSWYQRGGGDKSVLSALRSAKDPRYIDEHDLVGIIVTCYDECSREMPQEMLNAIVALGANAWEHMREFRRTPAYFIKDLRSGQVHANLIAGGGNTNGCETIFRSGHFKLDASAESD